jgi:hypothetical protein
MRQSFSAPVQTGPGAQPTSCSMGTGSFPGLESGWGVTLTPHPFYCRGPKTEKSYTSTLPKGPWPVKRVKPTFNLLVTRCINKFNIQQLYVLPTLYLCVV